MQAHLPRILHNQLRALQHSELQSLLRAYLEGEAPQLSEVAVILLAQQLGRGPRFSGPIPTPGVRLVLLDRIELPLALVLPLQVSALSFYEITGSSSRPLQPLAMKLLRL